MQLDLAYEYYKRQDIVNRTALGLWALLIAYFSLVPTTPFSGLGGGLALDKLFHFGAGFIFVFLAFLTRPDHSHMNYFTLTTGAVIYMLVLEYFQLFIPGRSFEALDVVAAALGAVLFFTLKHALRD